MNGIIFVLDLGRRNYETKKFIYYTNIGRRKDEAEKDWVFIFIFKGGEKWGNERTGILFIYLWRRKN